MSIIEVAAIISPLAAVLFSAFTWRRNAKSDDAATAREIAILTSEVRNNSRRIEHNSDRLESNSDKLEAKIESNARRLEEKIDEEHRRIDRLERGGG